MTMRSRLRIITTLGALFCGLLLQSTAAQTPLGTAFAHPGQLRQFWVVSGTALAFPQQQKVELCHVPPGDPDNAHTIIVGEKAAQSHLKHHADDYLGPCVSGCQGEGDCEDGDLCTADICLEDGTCDNPPLDDNHCNDGNPCTTDSCDPDVGCVNTAEVGLGCDDSNACTSGDVCDVEGACAGESIPGCCLLDSDCNDDDPCSVDTCQSFSCVNTPVDCDDGNPCTVNVCVAGECESAAASCDDANLCTDDSCDPETGCVNTNNAAACDDGNDCTAEDVCSDGTCSGKRTVDCAGECNGPAVEDCAGECNGPAVEDCAGECDGSAVLDCDNICDGPTPPDCQGNCFGDAIIGAGGACCFPEDLDDCGVCNGDGTGVNGCGSGNCASGTGTCVCGVCVCPEPFFGPSCSCTERMITYNGLFQQSVIVDTPLTLMEPNERSLSMEVWIQPTRNGQPIATRLGPESIVWGFTVGKNGDGQVPLKLRLFNRRICESGCVTEGNTAIPFDVWTHVAFTWDKDTEIAAFYINGHPDGGGLIKIPAASGGVFQKSVSWRSSCSLQYSAPCFLT